jgi:CBS domain containing-hemolysin-like protein
MSERSLSEAAKIESKQQKVSLAERLRSLFGMGGASAREDIEEALEGSENSSEFTPQERLILKNVLALNELRVANVMVPRADIIAVGLDATLSDVLALFRTAGHSRLPVYGDTLDDPRGMVHIRDFVDFLASCAENAPSRRQIRPQNPTEEVSSREAALARRAVFAGIDLGQTLDETKIVRPVLFAPPSMPALDLLVRMQATRTHMALVIDEYGGTDGLVSIEDLVEMIVGDIEDEHDVDERPSIEKLPDGSIVADARVDLLSASALAGQDLSALAEDEDVETLGGLIAAVAGRLPTRGEIIRLANGLELEVLDADPRRLKRLKILRPPGDESEASRNSSDPMSQSDLSPNRLGNDRRDA